MNAQNMPLLNDDLGFVIGNLQVKKILQKVFIENRACVNCSCMVPCVKKYLGLVLLIGLVIVLNGCDINSPSDPPDPGPDFTTLNSFEVEGNTADQSIPVAIVLPLQPNNANVSGDFNLFWDAVSSNPYTIEVYISSNSILDPIDTLFLRMQCGSDSFQFICDQLGDYPCVIAYEPDYQMVQDEDENGNPLVDDNGDPIMVRYVDPATGYFVVLEDHYYLRCANGPATVRFAEITDRVLLSGFPFTAYLIFKACATDELLCPEQSVGVQFYDSQP